MAAASVVNPLGILYPVHINNKGQTKPSRPSPLTCGRAEYRQKK
jgi:hypothetical protein